MCVSICVQANELRSALGAKEQLLQQALEKEAESVKQLQEVKAKVRGLGFRSWRGGIGRGEGRGKGLLQQA